MDEHAKELEYCTYCPKLCRHTCPVSNALGSETLIPQSKMELLNMLRRTAVPWELDYVLPIYGCTTCGLCRKYCKHDNDVAATLMAGRALGEQRRLVHPALARLEERFRTRNERLGTALRKELSPHLFAEEARVGFLPGCDTIDTSIDDIRDALSVFNSLDLNFVRIVDAPYYCVGYPLWAGGCIDGARFVAEEMVRAIRRFATVVTSCAACTWLLREKLPAEGFEHNTEVLHLTEYLYVHAERLDIRQRREAAFYHDPCYLARHLGVTEPPRRLIARCVDAPREFFYSGEEGECCGGGGLVPHTFPEAALGQARRRLEEARLYDVPLVVTACPTCKRTLQLAGTDIEVLDVVNLIASSLREPERRALEDHQSGDRFGDRGENARFETAGERARTNRRRCT